MSLSFRGADAPFVRGSQPRSSDLAIPGNFGTPVELRKLWGNFASGEIGRALQHPADPKKCRNS